MEEPKVSPNPRSTSRKLFENAVDDALFMVAYAAGKCKRDIDEETLTTLLSAKRHVDAGDPVDAKSEAEFWLAYQRIWTLVRPATAESIRANLRIESSAINKLFENIPSLLRWVEWRVTSRARKTVNRYIFFTVLVLVLLLVLQSYWVVGNQLTTQLAELLQKETDLSVQISENHREYSVIETRFKQNEMASESFKTNGPYTFYFSPEWERDTLENTSERERLETDLTSLESQVKRASDILLVWSKPWNWLIEQNVKGIVSAARLDEYSSQIMSIDRQINDINSQLLVNPDDAENNQKMEQLKEVKAILERQQGDINREISRQAQLAGQFVLVILQSYLLPLLYGILGAATYALRSLSKEIENVTYSEEAGIQHLMRISLGALAGIMVGWFSFLIPNETTTFFGSVSPLAIAFLVGYNIELFFSLMDVALNRVNAARQRTSVSTQKEDQTTLPQSESTSPATKTPPATETPVAGKAAG